MILGISELHKLVKKKKLVQGLSLRELQNPEGAGFDLRIGELYELKGSGFLGVAERETPKIKLIASYKKDGEKKIKLKPNTYYVMGTIEKVNLPENLVALMRPRTTLFRSGVHLLLGAVAPGYNGGLNFGMVNLRSVPFYVEMGARVVHIQFFQVQGKNNLYRGQWQGGRVTTKQTTKKREKQV
ncbi:MAG: 2'-deoxycytidine 5'-triphosphate deaminase [Candidatus Wolfebacteria bacterium]|nr:2'-deoxycytidine 5'-triphosphate deaminase [Candidatus Wolfebacteria bacterium]